MSITTEEARRLLAESELRVTAPRLAVLRVLSEAQGPLSHAEVLERVTPGCWDPTTIYRNLIKLRDAGVAPVISRAEGIARYALVRTQDENHDHPHFFCVDCERVVCLPTELTASMSIRGRWASSIKKATVQLRGRCPECMERAPKDRR